MKNFYLSRLSLGITCLLLSPTFIGCATRVKTLELINPPPSEAFSDFGRIEVKPIRMLNGRPNTSGVAKIQENLYKDLKSSLEIWNKRPDNGRKLVIEPIVDDLQFKHGAKRVLLGPLAGSSGVMMHLKVSDATGREISNPVFFQRADALSAGWTMGVHDNLMLTRVANFASRYIISNFEEAKGGPTGADDKALSAANK